MNSFTTFQIHMGFLFMELIDIKEIIIIMFGVYGSLLGLLIAYYFKELVGEIKSMKEQVINLNQKMAIAINQIESHSEKLKDHDDRIRVIERH